MRSLIYCVCLVTTIGISTTACASIIRIGDWEGDAFGAGHSSGSWGYSGAYSNSDGYEPLSWSSGEGWDCAYTTEGGLCYWSFNLDIYVEARVWRWDTQYANAGASGFASISCWHWPGRNSISALVTKWESQGHGMFEALDGDSETSAGTNQFLAHESIEAQHTAMTATAVPAGSPNDAYAHADVRASVNLRAW